MKKTALQKIIKKHEDGETNELGEITIRVSYQGYSITTFCNINNLKKSLKEIYPIANNLIKKLKL